MTPAIVFTQLAQALKLQTLEQCCISQIFFLFFLHWSNQSFRKESCAVVDPLLYMVSCGILETVRKIQHFYNSVWEGEKKKMFKIFISKCSKLCSDFHTLYLLGNDF